jgi:hypothetical protein
MTHQVSTTRKWTSFAVLAGLIAIGAVIYVLLPRGGELADDTNNDGKVDFWAWADDEGHLVRIEKDRNADGLADWREFFVFDEVGKKEVRQRIEADRDNDARFETTMHFDSVGVISKLEVDRNGDDKIDMIMHYDDRNKSPAKTERDEDFDGEFELVTTRPDPSAKKAQGK